MPKLNRNYKKGEPHRDSRLFVVVTEGEREDKYFSRFNQVNSRIRVLTVSRLQNASAPKHFIDRLDKAQQTGIYSPEPDDSVWFVCDVDRWDGQIHDLQTDCEPNPAWNLAVSNPCFEVWLYFHSDSISITAIDCQTLKTELPKTRLGQFNVETYCKHINRAVLRAEEADTIPANYFPAPMTTKVYWLAKEICKLIGHTWP